MLRDLRPGATVRILNIKDFTISQAEVLQTTAPVPQLNLQITQQGVMPPRQVMSVKVRWNGKEALFNNIFADQPSSESNDGSGLVVCENEDALTNELRTAKANFASLIENQSYFKKGEKWCDEQLMMRDPVKQAEVQNAKQLDAIKQEFNGMLAEQNKKIGTLTDNVSTLTDSVNSLLQALAGNINKGKE